MFNFIYFAVKEKQYMYNFINSSEVKRNREGSMSALTPCVLSPPQVCRLPSESTYSPTPLLKLIHVWCKNARSDPAPSLSQESKKSRRIGFRNEISVLLLSGIFPSWPNEKPTSRSAMSSATFSHSSWQRTRPRRLSPW